MFFKLLRRKLLVFKNLDKQVYIYSLDTAAFYNDKEYFIHNQLLELYSERDKLNKDEVDYKEHKKVLSEKIGLLKKKLRIMLKENEEVRLLRESELIERNIISIFDSVLTRTLKIKNETISKDIIVVQVYYFEVLNDLIKHGFIYNDEKYIYFSSSAGQIRQKKSVFIRESVWNEHKNTITCGLNEDDINNHGGINLTKYQAYKALTNSASVEWKNFDINRCIVVDDLETNVHSLVDYIDRDTYEITRKIMDIPIEHTDGCGMILPKKSKKAFMVRLPWIKGLLVPFPFDKFADEHDTYIVKDIYGKEHDIRNLEVIFTKSQFKMWNYYPDWQDYKNKFIKYHCQAARLNEEDTSSESNLNYQMLQTLTDITNEELEHICKDTIEDILRVGNDKKTMLRILGATETNKHKNDFQEALFLYPELLNDTHSKETIKAKKKSMVRDARSAKLNIKGKYTFLIPDLYAACQKWFLGMDDPKGLLKDGEVYCNLYEVGKVDVLRAPHLYREHGIRENVIDETKSKWFITNGIYTSVHDSISKMLQFDNDGDKALVISDKTFVNVAERNMEGIVPLYYKMSNAEADTITSESVYNSLILAYKANIGVISNNITKVWNSDTVDLDVIKWLCMENNFEIDYAKTLFKPTRPIEVHKKISQFIKGKVPHFFVYAKGKDIDKVDLLNDSPVNKLEHIIPNKRIQFKEIAGNFDYKMLMKRKNVKLDEEIIKLYVKLDRSKKWRMKELDELNSNRKLYVYKEIRESLLELNPDAEYITDVLIKYLYDKKNSSYKTTLWNSFGDVIVQNLKINLEGTKQCEECGIRVEKTSAKKYCRECATEKERERVRRYRKKI